VKDMFYMHNMRCNIHKAFPKDKLFDIMKPYLKLYFTSNFSMSLQKKDIAYQTLHKKMHAFIKFNPNFGKRKIRMVEIRPFSNQRRCEYYFDDRTLPFLSSLECKKDNKSFMTSHLEECDDDDDLTPFVAPISFSASSSASSSYHIEHENGQSIHNDQYAYETDDEDEYERGVVAAAERDGLNTPVLYDDSGTYSDNDSEGEP
jgi:hypothetical protein